MFRKITLILLGILSFFSVIGESWIRINQLGYLPQSVKVAVFISTEPVKLSNFQIVDTLTGKVVFKGQANDFKSENWGMKSSYRLNFSKLERPGDYYIRINNVRSSVFRIAPDVFEGTADFILRYMRQQRCGFNPFFKDSCHTHDGFIVDHPTRTGEVIDVTGGWHDASDYLQYVTTSANATYQMLFAYMKHPGVFNDRYDGDGLESPNGVPDILDEVRWGLEWLLKMNPDSGIMFNQIADDRDHKGFRLPTLDTVSYGNGLFRPVYFITGKPQGLSAFKNRTTGVSSTAGKYCSSFALGACVFKQYDPSFAEKLASKAKDAYEFALADPGVTQTACTVSPYFYEEDNYADDLELGAWELFRLTENDTYLRQANYWGMLEPVTPWMEKGSARHYQYYPFINLGHANLALSQNADFAAYMKRGLEYIYERGKKDPFLNGVPFIWCSNNLVVATITQARLYFESTHDSTYMEMEASLRDWLFGCNPWGTSMICGVPLWGDYPEIPHSAITLAKGVTTYGGLVDGPVFREIFESLKGEQLTREDPYKPFQYGKAVYHDDLGDYSTNEPTMDGTASLSFYLSFLEEEGKEQGKILLK